jgi:hypothetical protein
MQTGTQNKSTLVDSCFRRNDLEDVGLTMPFGIIKFLSLTANLGELI